MSRNKVSEQCSIKYSPDHDLKATKSDEVYFISDNGKR